MPPDITFKINAKAGSLTLTYDEMLHLLLDFRDLARAQNVSGLIAEPAQGIAQEASGERDMQRESLAKAQKKGAA